MTLVVGRCAEIRVMMQMAVEASTASQGVGRSKLCVEPLKLARLAGAPGSLLWPIVELVLEAEKTMMQQQDRPLTGHSQSGSPGGLALDLALADETVSADQPAKPAP